jgi:endonuclease III
MAKKEDLKEKVKQISKALKKMYPQSAVQLKYSNAYEILIATILSAQTTDEQVNKSTPNLFKKFPDPAALANAKKEEVIELIKSTGFFNNKAKSIMGAAKAIEKDYNGKVPDTMEELIKLPGVARKTANIVLGNYFDKNEGIAVDTHVKRVSQRLGFSNNKDANKIEKDLMIIVPKNEWTNISNELIWHGRKICKARKPMCEQCEISKYCDYYENEVSGKS